MKKRILLIDESLTVQKVVALTLDRNRYAVSYAKSRSEAMKEVLQNSPDLILVSDQVTDLNIASFPKEVESWVGRERKVPPMILITGQDVKESRNFQAVLRKPFSPQALQAVVIENAKVTEEVRSETVTHAAHEEEDGRLQKIFNDTFADEAKLTRETFEAEAEDGERTLLTIPAPTGGRGAALGRAASKAPVDDAHDDVWGEPSNRAVARAEPEQKAGLRPPPQETAADLWGSNAKASEPESRSSTRPSTAAPAPTPTHEIMGAKDSVAYKGVLEKQAETQLRNADLEAVIERLLGRMMPPIVERIVQERLDKLMREQEQFVELKQ